MLLKRARYLGLGHKCIEINELHRNWVMLSYVTVIFYFETVTGMNFIQDEFNRTLFQTGYFCICDSRFLFGEDCILRLHC